MANYGQGATLFTLGPNHTVEQYDVSHSTLVKRVQYQPMLAPPVPSKPNQSMPQSGNQSLSATAPHKPGSHGSDPSRAPVTLSTIQRSAKDMLSAENVRLAQSDISSPISASSRNRADFSSSISSNPRYERTNRSNSSYAASGTTFSALSPSMVGRDSVFSGGSSIFPGTQTGSRNSSGWRSKGSRLRQEYHRSPVVNVDLFPRTRKRLKTVTYSEPRTLDQEGLSPDDLRKQMLAVVFGWDRDIEPLIRDEIMHHDPGSTSAVLLSKWLGEVDPDMMAGIMNSGTSSSSDWMLLALSTMGGGQDSMGKMGEAFVQKLLQQGDFHTSATILLSVGNHEDALEVYVSRRYYMEAILLTCLVFPTNWQKQAHLVRRWGESVMENSQQQLAVRCFTCTGMNPPTWATRSTRSTRSESTASQPTPSISSVLGPPISPPPSNLKGAGSVRMTTKNSSLKVITSFGAPGEARFKFPGLRSDDCTPTNAPGITPIAESAISPGETPGGLLRHSRYKNNLPVRMNTPSDAHRNRLPSIGETPIDVTLPLFPRPSALPTPDNSGSEFEKEGKGEIQNAQENNALNRSPEPPLLLSSARYDPGSAITIKTPRTALPGSSFPASALPDPSKESFSAFAEKSQARNGSRDRKPDGLQIQMPAQTHTPSTYLPSEGRASNSDDRQTRNIASLRSSGSLSGRFDSTSERCPSISGQSWASAKSPVGTSRSTDQYISSIDEAARKQKITSRLRQASRERRTQTGDKKSRSRHRAHDRSEDRSRNQKYIQPAKRSPSSPVPMSPDDIHRYLDNPNTDSLNGQLAGPPSTELESSNVRNQRLHPKGISNLRSGSKASGHSSRTAVRRSSPEGLLDGCYRNAANLIASGVTSSRAESPEGSLIPRGRSMSRNHDSAARSPSSPLPMSPQSKHAQRSEEEDDPLRFVDANRQRIRSRQRKWRERGTSSRRNKSPDRRGVPENQYLRATPLNSGTRQPQSAIESNFTSTEFFDEALERPARKSASSDMQEKKALAARELEARRESLARRPLGPNFPHPINLSTRRPSLGMRSQSDICNSPTSRHNATPPLGQQAQVFMATSARNDSSAHGNRAGAVSVGPYGLPATPRAMRHPTYEATQAGKVPAVPELPKTILQPFPTFHTNHPIPELPRSMSAPAPEQALAQPDLPSHRAFHKALGAGSKRSDFGTFRQIGQHRHLPSMESHVLSPGQGSFYDDETLQAADSTVQITTIEQPPLLPELQHLSSVVPPPPPHPTGFPTEAGAHNSVSSGSGLGVINIAIDDQPRELEETIIDVPATDRITPTTLTRSNSNQRRGRSENFINNIKGITDRLRSTSRGRNISKPQQADLVAKPPSAYESVPALYF